MNILLIFNSGTNTLILYLYWVICIIASGIILAQKVKLVFYSLCRLYLPSPPQILSRLWTARFWWWYEIWSVMEISELLDQNHKLSGAEKWKLNWDAFFDKSGGGQGRWMKIPDNVREWTMSHGDLLAVPMVAYRHVGVFPEQAMHWDWTREVIKNLEEKITKSSISSLAYMNRVDWCVQKKEKSPCRWIKADKLVGTENMEPRNFQKIRSLILMMSKSVEKLERKYIRWFYHGSPVFGHGANGKNGNLIFFSSPARKQKIISQDPIFFLVNTYASSIFSTTLAKIFSQISSQNER